jgi:NAD+ kinase
MKVALYYKKEDKHIRQAVKSIVKKLQALKLGVSIEKSGSADFIISVGGDGTLLRTAKKFAGKNIPILGVHIGGLGFINELEYKDWQKHIRNIINGNYYTDKRQFLEIKILRKGKIIYQDIALNDAVITKSGIARVIILDVSILKKHSQAYLADGLIVATATGSTAYNLSAGGRILPASSKSLVVTPICPHHLSKKSIITKRPVLVTLKRGQHVVVTTDGQSFVPFMQGDKLIVKPSKNTVKFIRLRPYNQYKNLKIKLGVKKRV